MTEHDARTASNLTAAAIFSELQSRLMENPFASHPAPATKQEKTFRRGFRRGLGQALSWVSEACRSGREMDAVVAEIERDTAERVLAEVRRLHRSAGDLSVPARFEVELDAIGRLYGVES